MLTKAQQWQFFLRMNDDSESSRRAAFNLSEMRFYYLSSIAPGAGQLEQSRTLAVFGLREEDAKR